MLNYKNYAIMEKKTYQVLLKGIYSNKLSLIETESFKDFKKTIDDFEKGKFPNLVLIDTNIC